MMIKRFFFFSLFFAINYFTLFAKETSLVSILSPDKHIDIQVFLRNDSLFYNVQKDGTQIVNNSNLGIRLIAANFLKDLTFVESKNTNIDETYELPSGKQHNYRNNCSESECIFSNSASQNISVIFRVYNDGVAFRYKIARESGSASFYNEVSEVNINGFEYSWGQEYRNDYSWYYYKRNSTETENEKEFSAPVLVQSNHTNFLLTEAENNGSYASSKLVSTSNGKGFLFAPIGDINVTYPFETPWRTIIIGTLPEIVQSVMISNLNPQTNMSDISWIKPGRSSWNWGGEDAVNSISFEIVKKYIDLAHDMGWEYFTLDDGWDGNDADFSLADVVNYATSKSVGVILWSNQNRFTNDYSQMNNILSGWKAIGIKGVKVDFWEDDSQQTMQKYETLLNAAADNNLLVDLHGCTKPSGLRRTWPNLLTSEAVLGGEMYLFNSTMTPPEHNINLTITRNVIGSMDYTPGDFGTKNGIVRQYTTWSHQLALLTAFESGIQDYNDCPQNYKYHIAESFLKRIPVAWDSIICTEAKPDSFVTIARKKGDDWFVVSLCNNKRKMNFTPYFLNNDETYDAYIYKDGDCNSEIKFDYITGINSTSNMSIVLLNKGGFTIQFTKSTNLPKPNVAKYEAESTDNKTYAVKTVDDSGMCSGGKYISQLGKINYLRFQKINVPETGQYAMTVFYMTGEDRSAYVKVNNGDELIYTFKSSGGYSGNTMGFSTILVNLQQGDNIIEFGNNTDYCPNIDRITIKNVSDSIYTDVVTIKDTNDFKIYTANQKIFIDCEFTGNYFIYDTMGHLVKTNKLDSGNNEIRMSKKGIFIINILTGFRSYSQKVIVNN